MIKPEELRIGNYVYDEGDLNHPIQMVVIKKDNTSWLVPIPLSEQWLIDFGFEKKDITHIDGSISEGVYYKYPCIVEKNKLSEEIETKYRFCRIITSGIREHFFLTFMYSVHHLQNLFYDLTGQKLKLHEKEDKS